MQSTLIGLRLPEQHRRLARRLEEFSSAARPGDLTLALQFEGDPLFIDYHGPGTLQTIAGAASPRVPTGCLAKPLTASLLAQVVAAGKVDWSSQINDVLEVRGNAGSKLEGITFSHLLNHTHGLDASIITAVPGTPGGLIDATVLCERLATTPLSAPGELYSYSNAGAWLAGAALERLTGTRYSQLLSAKSSTFSVDFPADLPSPLCPATGGCLEITTAQWLSFAEAHANADPLAPDPIIRGLAALRSPQAALPGWSPAERAACLGWKYYGEGWFGHTANMPAAISFLRFNPSMRVAIMMSATSDIALFAFSCLFRDYFPELKNLKFPRRLTRSESESLRRDSYIGLYAQANTQIEIAGAGEGLSITIAADDPSTRSLAQALQAADRDIFFPEGKRNPEFPFIQFIRCPGGDPSFSHIWNGKQLWKRR